MEHNRNSFNQTHFNQAQMNHLAKRLARLKSTLPQTGPLTEQERQLRQSIDIVNQLINENTHRPESVRLLRKILRERAEVQWVKRRDENSLSG